MTGSGRTFANSSLWEHKIECESGKLVDLAEISRQDVESTVVLLSALDDKALRERRI